MLHNIVVSYTKKPNVLVVTAFKNGSREQSARVAAPNLRLVACCFPLFIVVKLVFYSCCTLIAFLSMLRDRTAILPDAEMHAVIHSLWAKA